MRPRRAAIPRLEAIEDRVVPSAMSVKLSPTDTAHLRSANRSVMQFADNVQNSVASLFHQKHAVRSVSSPFATAHKSASHHKTEYLFGIPFIKI